MRNLLASTRQALPIVTNAAAPEVDTDQVSAILALLDNAILALLDNAFVAHQLRSKLAPGAVFADFVLFAHRLEHAEYSVTLWASSKQLQASTIVHDHGNTTTRVMRIHAGDIHRPIVTLQWPAETKPAAVMGALRGWRPGDHWSDEKTLTDEERAERERLEAGHA